MRLLTLQEVQDLAASKGGKFLSSEYRGSKILYQWQCAHGHVWEARQCHIKGGHWCPFCAGQRSEGIKELRKIAKSHGGKCLSPAYVNAKSKLLWECAHGHQWEATADKVRNGKAWCHVCAGNKKKSIADAQELARSRGGECLSEKYVNKEKNLTWRCADGHEWEASYGNINRGRWCPHCNTGVGESFCRQIFEGLFKAGFPKIRLDSIRAPDTGEKLELDGYCAEHAIAFEYQGRQHYEKDYFDSDVDFDRRVELDKFKRKRCLELGIKLIEIPQVRDVFAEEDEIVNHIRNCIRNAGVNVDDAAEIRALIARPSKLREFAAHAESRGGKLLSTAYRGARGYLEWRCAQGHAWYAAPDMVVKRGSWCKECYAKLMGTHPNSKVRSWAEFNRRVSYQDC